MRVEMALVVAVLLTACGAVKVSIPPGPLSSYTLAGYRQLPYFAVGLYSKDSFLSHISGHTDLHPRIEVNLDASGGPAQYFQVFVYNADVIEGSVMPLHGAATPCMDAGQSRGVAMFPEMEGFAFALNAGAVMVGPAAQYSSFAVRERIFPQNSGLYVVTLNACRYVNHTGARRSLVLDDWGSAHVSGTISFRNPFGYLPGQQYGFLPSYTVFLVLSLAVWSVALLFSLRAGFRSLLQFQKVLFLVASLCVLAYILLLAYYSRLNTEDEDLPFLFIGGKILVMLRNTFGAGVVMTLCIGSGIVAGSVSTAASFTVTLACCARLVLNIIEFGLYHESTSISGGMWGVASAQKPNLGWKITRAFGLAFDCFFGAIAALYLYTTIRRLGAAGMKRRHALYRRTAAALLVGAVLGVAWAALVTNLSDGPLGSFGEAHWKIMWLPDVVFELLYFVTFSSVCMVWLPRKADLLQLAEEIAPSRSTQNRRHRQSTEDVSTSGSDGSSTSSHPRRRKAAADKADSVELCAVGEGDNTAADEDKSKSE